MKPDGLFLADLYTGETAEIIYMDINFTAIKRLRDMGLKEGILVELISYDPVINKKVLLKVNNAYLGFVSELANFIRVRSIKSFYHLYKERAMHASLTGCPNRNAANLFLAGEYEKAVSNKLPFSLILIDIDNFKKINDTYGHDFGDRVLRKVGEMLKKNIRRIDNVFRWGGEEFLILMKGVNLKQCYIIAERLRELAKSIEISPFGTGIVTISAGIDGTPPYISMDELLNRADKALYMAKKRGKNMVCTFYWRYANENV